MAVMQNLAFDRNSEHWRDRAACRSTDPELFFPAGSTGDAVAQIQSAKRVCLSCPVQVACLQFALDTHQEAGIWGGMDEDGRRRLRRHRRAGRRLPVGLVIS